jgi:predicted alpha/beta-hydrolase family hydrolase
VVPTRRLRFPVGERAEVGALLCRPDDARWLFVLAHGAGAGMEHPFLAGVSRRLASRRIACFRYQFPYAERGARRPDSRPVLLECARAAVAAARREAPDLPLLAGGKSMGGRMTSLAAAHEPLPGVRGVAFLGFPLHAAGRPSVERAEHLEQVALPLLFVQGTRDGLADLELLEPVCRRLGDRATLRVVEAADHSFRVTRRSGRSADDALDEVADAVESWAAALGA